MTPPAEPKTRISDLRLFILMALPTFLVFFGTADRSIPYHIDPFTNVLSASTIGTTGSPILSEYAELSDPDRFAVFAWVVSSPKGPISQYPPGTALLAAPLYSIAGEATTIDLYAYNDPEAAPVEVEVPPLWPAALIASLTSSFAVAFTVLSTRAITGSPKWAAMTGIVLAAGTGLWLNGAYQLWQHGPASMWIAASVWAAAKARWTDSGVLAGFGVLTRPPVAIIAVGIGATAAIRTRSWRPVLGLATGGALGAALLLAYNYWAFDTLTISGGYGSGFSDRLLDGGAEWYFRNLAGAFLSLDRGIFVWSPIVAVAAVGVIIGSKWSPEWATGALIGGVLLLLLQYRLNRYSGGDGFYSYRYPLEAIVASTPILALGAKHIWESSRLRLVVPVAAVASIGNHLVSLVRELA